MSKEWIGDTGGFNALIMLELGLRGRLRDAIRGGIVVVTFGDGAPRHQGLGVGCADLEEVLRVEIARVQDVPHADPEGFLARPFLEGSQANVRVVRLAGGQALPAHRHGESDLMLYVSDGQGELETPTGKVPFTAGCLAW